MPKHFAWEKAAMLYKTIVIELLHTHLELYEQLRSSKRLLPAMEAYAIELKALHEEWKNRISQWRPGSDSSQVESEALELAIERFRDRLPSESATDETEPLSLDAAMNYLRRHSPVA
jgi:hypothetical protein